VTDMEPIVGEVMFEVAMMKVEVAPLELAREMKRLNRTPRIRDVKKESLRLLDEYGYPRQGCSISVEPLWVTRLQLDRS
nr:hypothetical protein [Tanacetum cinerariifolium]